MSGRGIRIAIVGMGARFADAHTPDELWHTVLGRRRAFREIPSSRLDLADYGGAPDDVDATYVRQAAVLRDWEFDRVAFRVPGSLYRAVDHSHWLALDTAREALADAGFPDGEGLDRDRTGVLIGNSLAGEFSRAGMLRLRWPFLRHAVASALAESGVDGDRAAEVLERAERLVKAPFPVPGGEMLAGGLSNTIAGRVCNYFDFHGSGYTVDGACASSLLAMISAAEALARGELSFALAGGVDLSLDPFELVGFARVGALAHDEMRVYDADPTGFLPGEGCGVVALMLADEAERQGLRSYATMIGWGTSTDGAGGITRPETSGQIRALTRAYSAAGVDPAGVGLIEGHGTGTSVGDRVELAALIEVRRRGSTAAALGSVKANIGHTKAAAGVAGLIKTALAAYHRVLPPMTGNRTPHRLLTQPDAPLRLLDEPEPWRAARPLAGVSAAGFGGVNAHVVLEGPARNGSANQTLPRDVRRWAARVPSHEPVFLDAGDPRELRTRLGQLEQWAGAISLAELHDLAATMSARRTVGSALRCVLVAGTPAELVTAARAALSRLDGWDQRLVVDETLGVALGAGAAAPVGLLLPGQAAPVRDQLGELANLLPAPPPIPEGIAGAAGETHTAIAQPAIVWQSLAGLAWLERLGCEPVGAVGHSLGELTALAWAGAIDPRQAQALATRRGAVLARYGKGGTGMLAVGLSAEAAVELARGTSAVLAAENGPTASVLAGPRGELATLAQRAANEGIAANELPVSHGFHSPAMLEAVPHWRTALDGVTFSVPTRKVYSTVTGESLTASDDPVELLVEQLTKPVRWLTALRALAERVELLVEVGPGTMLGSLAADTGLPAVSLDCGGSTRRLAMATGALVAAGSADLTAWFADRAHRHLEPGKPLSFLANPCESVPKGASRRDLPVEVRREPVAVQRDPELEPAGPTEVLAVLRRHLAEELELPLASITADTRLLTDLHLNSLQVAQLVASTAAALGKRPQAMPGVLAGVTVADVAAVLDELPDATGENGAGVDEVAGIRPWVRLFGHHWVEHRTEPARAPVDWRVRAPRGHRLHGILTSSPDAPVGLAVALTDADGVPEIAALLRELAESPPARLLVVHSNHPAAAALGRSVAAELDGCAVTVLDVARDAELSGLVSVVVSGGYAELRRRSDGMVERAVTRPHPNPWAPARLPLGLGDVCLVTGGVTGITAHCAAALAEATGCALVVLGRKPADHPAVVEGLAGLGSRAHYLSCDVTDRGEVTRATHRAAGYGPVRGLLHGAGTNQPQRMAAIIPESLRATVGPKIDGMRSILAAVGDQLRLVVGFGSIIGRQGLAGQAEYCVANDWQRVELERWAAAHRSCRTHLIEWSVWSGIGMGVRLNVVDSLAGLGVARIAPDDGVAALLQVLVDPHAPVTVLATGRFPASSTLALEQHHPSSTELRFAESVLTRTPGVETVVRAELSTGTDPYLDEHRISGVAVLPAVLGLEAMAQTAALTVGYRDSWTFRDIRFTTPVTVGDRETRTIQVAALAQPDPDGPTVELRLRQNGDGFAADHFTARVVPAEPPPPPSDPVVIPPRAESGPHPAYGPLLFHSGRFQRLGGYEVLSAFTVRAWITPPGPAAHGGWFSAFHGQRLLLGDAAAHDATIHALLACVPHRRALPVEVDELTVWRRPEGTLMLHARETNHTATEYFFDVDVTTVDGRPVAHWGGLRLRAIGDNEAYAGRQPASPLPVDLIGPWLSRRLIECGWAGGVELVTAAGRQADGAGAALLARLLGLAGEDVALDLRGQPKVPGRYAGASYLAGHILAGVSDEPIGLDWQPVNDSSTLDQQLTLGPAGRQAVDELAGLTGETFEVSVGRVSVARQALLRLGFDPDTPLSLDEITGDGLVASSGGGVRMVTALCHADLAEQRVALAIATRQAPDD